MATTSTTDHTVVAAAPPARRLRLQAPERFLLLGIWVLLYAVFVAIDPGLFLRGTTVSAIFSAADVYVLLGLAALIPFYVGEFDLSIAYIMGLAATLVPLAYTQWGVPIGVAVLIAMVAAGGAGLLNGFVVVRLGVDPLITTLGTGTVFAAVASGLSDQRPASGLTAGFSDLAATKVLGTTSTFWYGLLLALAISYVLYLTPLGKRMTFVGSNREVSRLAGIRVNRVRYGGYVAGGLVGGLAGVLLSAKLGGFDPAAASGYLLPTFATVFLSAAVVTLGKFNPIGVVIAAGFIATGTLGLQLLGLSGWTQQLFYGGSLVAAVTMVTLVNYRRGGAA